MADCVARLAAMETDTTERISLLRRRVDDIVASLDHAGGGGDDHRLRKAANKLLHGPMLQLREGTLSEDEIEDVARMIERELLSVSSRIEQR